MPNSALRIEGARIKTGFYDIVFFHLYENVEGIIRSRKDLMRNTFDFMDEPKRVPQEVCDELGIQLPEPESDY